MTRFGLGVAADDWYEPRLALFEAVTLPSVAGQTTHAFEWIVVADLHTPDWVIERLRAMLEPVPHAWLVAVDTEAADAPAVGTMALHDTLTEILLGEGIVTDVGGYYLTAIIDNDDAWHRGTMSAVLAAVEAEAPSLWASGTSDRPAHADAGYLTSHSDGIAFTFPRGLIWFPGDATTFEERFPFHSMSCFVLTRFSSGISVASCRHALWGTFAVVAGFRIRELDLPEPAWLYTRHIGNVTHGSTSFRGAGTDIVEEAAPRSLERIYGVDVERAKAAVEIDQEPASASDPAPPFQAHTNDVLGLQFLIAALGRQIEVLTERCAAAAPGEWIDQQLAETTARRERLIRRRRDLMSRSWAKQ